MDTVTLVNDQLRDGERLIDQLSKEGFPVRVAGWVKPADEDRWSLYLAIRLVDEKGPIEAYREVYRVLRSLGSRVQDYEVKLVGENHRVVSDFLEAQSVQHSRKLTGGPLTSVGGMPVDAVYVYPSAKPNATGPRQSVLRFVLRTSGPILTVMSRFNPQGKVVLNRTEWRGKEPRSCGIVSVRSRPHADGSTETAVFDIEVAYRPKGSITYSGGTKYDGWTALMLDRRQDGTLLDGAGNPLPEGHPPVYLRVELYEDADFNEIDFGEFVGEFEVEGVRHVAFEHVMGRVKRAGRVNIGMNASFVAPRRRRPRVKIVLSNNPSGTGVDGFGTRIISVNNTTPQLRQVVIDHVTEVINGFVEGRYSIKSMSTDEFVYVELDDVLVDCTPNYEGKESRFDRLPEFLPELYLDELAIRLTATYDVDVSVVDGPKLGLLLRRIERSQEG